MTGPVFVIPDWAAELDAAAGVEAGDVGAAGRRQTRLFIAARLGWYEARREVWSALFVDVE